MKILIWRNHPGDPLSGAIEALTRGQYTHAALLINEPAMRIAEAYYPALRTRDLTDAELPGIDVFEVAGLTPEIEGKLIDWWAEKIREHAKYSIVDLLRFLAPVRAVIGEPSQADAEKHMFCSMAVVQSFADCGLPLTHEPSWCVDPERLSGCMALTKIGDGTILKH